MLLAVHTLALGVACIFCVGMIALHRRNRRLAETEMRFRKISHHTIFPRRPISWLAVRTANPERVQTVLGLSHSIPCSWSEGMAGEHEFFVSPRINGWVIVTGVAIPGSDDDIDECFRFLISLSRQLGHVQYFFAEKFTHHHAWARVDDGCVTRAYAWTGETLWNQGAKTLPEIDLGLNCFGYGEDCPSLDIAETNCEKVAALAARWSLDPAAVDERSLDHAAGVAGQLPQFY